MTCIGGGTGGRQHPVERQQNQIKRLVSAIVATCVFSATAMVLPLVAFAQSADIETAQIEAALNLEDVPTASGVPALTVTNALGAVAHIFPTVRGAVLRSQAVQTPLCFTIAAARSCQPRQSTAFSGYHRIYRMVGRLACQPRMKA